MVSPQGPSTFIPKNPTKSSPNKPRAIRKIYVFTYLSLVIFFGTLIAAAGTFFLAVTVGNQLDAQKQALANERNAFNASDLVELRQLDKRINSAKQLLASHVSVANIFTAIERATIETVQLVSFSYTRSQVGNIDIEMNALATSLNDARYQVTAYGSDDTLQKAGLNEPAYTSRQEQLTQSATLSNEEAQVTFTMSGRLGVDDIRYNPNQVNSFNSSASVPMSSGSEASIIEVQSSDSEVSNVTGQ